MTAAPPLTIYTIGHSTHAPEYFLELLQTHGIQVVADVRSRPYSRRAPQFNRDALQTLLAAQGLTYLFLGRELGGKPPELESTAAHEVVWRYLKSRPQFQEGLARLLEAARAGRVAMLCAEADPRRCHRGELIAPELEARGVRVIHILPDGQAVDHRVLKFPAAPAQKRLF